MAEGHITLERETPVTAMPIARQGVTIEVAEPRAFASLRVAAEGIASLSRAVGVPLPKKALGASGSKDGARAALWLGPDEWLVIGGVSDDLVQAASGAKALHSIVDISHRLCAVTLSGPRAQAVLNAGCPLDLSNEAFPAGSATRTVMGKIEIVLWRRGPDQFEVFAARSFVPYAWDFLAAASLDPGT